MSATVTVRPAPAPSAPLAGGWLVVCPAYNEAGSLHDVVAEIHRELPGAQVVVVDDGSADRTAEIAVAAGARLLRFPFNQGIGAALRAGLLLGVREGAAGVVQCDADGQHPPAAIDQLLAGLADADVVVGVRFAGVGDYEVRGPRRWAMRLLSWVVTRMLATPLTDVTSGFRAYGPRAMAVLSRELPPEYLGDSIDGLLIAHRHGLVITQVPVAMRARVAGVPSQSSWKATVYLARALLILGLSVLRTLGVRRPRVRSRA